MYLLCIITGDRQAASGISNFKLFLFNTRVEFFHWVCIHSLFCVKLNEFAKYKKELCRRFNEFLVPLSSSIFPQYFL